MARLAAAQQRFPFDRPSGGFLGVNVQLYLE